MFKRNDLIKLAKKYDRKMAAALVTIETDKRMELSQNKERSRRDVRKEALIDLKKAISFVDPENHYKYTKSKSEIYIQAYKWLKTGICSTRSEAIRKAYKAARREAFEYDTNHSINVSKYILESSIFQTTYTPYKPTRRFIRNELMNIRQPFSFIIRSKHIPLAVNQ